MFSTNDPRPPYNPTVLKENFERDNKYFRIHETFNPSLTNDLVTGKFYSVNERMNLSEADPELVERITLFKEGTPKQRYRVPLTGNQIYGWESTLLVPLNKGDTRYYAPRNASLTKTNFMQRHTYFGGLGRLKYHFDQSIKIMKFPTHVLKERFDCERKYFRIHDTFNPSINRRPITGKFYSVYDMLDLSLADNETMEKLAILKEAVPRDRYPAPVTTNQIYGWDSKPLIPINKGDNRFYAPKNRSITLINITMGKKKI